MNNDIVLRSIKLLDITYISGIYGVVAIVISILLNSAFGEFDQEHANSKSLFRLFLEIWIQLSVISIVAYIIRNIIELIPFPLDGVSGFSHKKVKELSGGIIYSFLFFFYQTGLRNKIDYTINRFKNKI